jgi:hypothetical protein
LFFGLVSLPSGCLFAAVPGSLLRSLIEAALRRIQMNLPRTLTSEFVRRQPTPLRVVILVHLVLLAHWISPKADLKVRLYSDCLYSVRLYVGPPLFGVEAGL